MDEAARLTETVAIGQCVIDDLADRRPGSSARAQALRAKEAAPVRTALARMMRVHTSERAWRLGAVGEELVAAELSKLVSKDPRWRVLHAIPVGTNDADIDHLVVGPAGVFTLNSKHHPGARIWVGGSTLMVNGVRHPYIGNSRHEAGRAARLLTAACGFPVMVMGVIVTVRADDLVVKKAPDDVQVLTRRQLRRWLRRRPDVLD
ncbi:MAG: hypothetical protein JWO67_4310, partial [Streptosporangiaceae bacterium]|nr:hypothetical protein [Streptosporangiaceae bacterium]